MKRFLFGVLSLSALSFFGSAVEAQTPAIAAVKLRMEPRTDLGELHGLVELVAEDDLEVWELDARNMTIDAVQAGYFNFKRPVDYLHDGTKLRIDWKGQPRDGQPRRLFITYRAVPPELQGRNLSRDLKKQGIIITNPNPPLPEDPLAPAVDYKQWASSWVPLVDAPNQRFQLLLALYVPKKIEVRACGKLVWDVDDDDNHLVVYSDDRQSPATLFWALGKESVIEKKEEVLAVAAKQFDLDRIETEQRLKLQRLDVLNQSLHAQSALLSAKTGKEHPWATIQELMGADSTGYWSQLYARALLGFSKEQLQQELAKRWFYEVLADTNQSLAKLALRSLVEEENLSSTPTEFESRLVYRKLLAAVNSTESCLKVFLHHQQFAQPEQDWNSRIWRAYFEDSPVKDEESWLRDYFKEAIPQEYRSLWLSVLKNKQVPTYSVEYRWVAGNGEVLEVKPVRGWVKTEVPVLWSCRNEKIQQRFLIDSTAQKWVLACGSMPDRVQVDPSGWLPILWRDNRPETFLLGQLQQGNELERWEAYSILLQSKNVNLRSTVMGIALDEPVEEFRRMALEAAAENLDAAARKKLGPTLERLAGKDPVEELRKMAAALVGG